MIDKVQKIRAFLVGIADADGVSTILAKAIENKILPYIDSLQEEPKFKTGDHIRPIDSSLGSPRTILEVCDGWYVTDQGTLDFEYEDNWEAVEEPAGLDKRKLMDMLENSLSKETKESWNKRLDEDEEPVSEDLEEEVHNFSLHYHGDIVTDEDGIHLCDINESKLLEIAHHFAGWGKKQAEIEIQAQSIAIAHGCPEESVSEDLEKAAEQYATEFVEPFELYYTKDEVRQFEAQHEDSFKAGAKWQEEKDNEEKVLIYKHGFDDCKEQFEKNRLAACNAQTEKEAEIEQSFVMGIIEKEHRQPTFDDAIKYGMRLQKEKIMANTTDAMICLPYENKDGGYTHLIDVSRPLPVGDNKIAIIFKED